MVKIGLQLLIFCFIFASQACAQQLKNNFSMDLQNIAIQDAIHIIANYLHQDIIISPKINGLASIHLHAMSAQDAFRLLLLSHDLIQQKIGHTLYILPRAEFIELQQEEIKLQYVKEESATLHTQVWPIRFAKAEVIARLLQDNSNSFLSKRGHVQVDTRTNMICVEDTEIRLNELHHIVERLDIPVKQVLIEARLVSIDYDFERELGINFTVNNLLDNAENPSSGGRYRLAVATLPDGSQLDVQLAAIENSGHGELISNPSLFTGNQQTASIESGEEIPYQEISRSGGTAVAFKKAVLSLKVTPQILSRHELLLQLQVNQDRPSDRLVQGLPAIITRQISTNVLVHGGQTIVLGGIYEMNQENAEQRIPFLGKMPLVGWLFKQQNVKEGKRELLIFVTPKIIS